MLPGLPVEEDDVDEDQPLRAGKAHTGGWESELPRTPWWKPQTQFGRALLSFGVLAAVIGLGTASFYLHNFLTRDARFRVEGVTNIETDGLSQVTRADLLPVFGEDVGKNIFFVRLGERRDAIEQIPWVERATVMRLLPDRLRVQIVERKPVAFVRHGSQIELVDAGGVLLAMSPARMAQHQYSFPVLTGIDAQDSPLSRRQRMAVYNRLIGELDANGQSISRQISEIDLSDPEDAQVMMPETEGDVLAHFGEDRFPERYQRYKAHIAEWKQQVPHLGSVDLRYEEHVYLKARAGSEEKPADAGKPEAAQAVVPAAVETPAKKAEDPAAGKAPAKPAADKVLAANHHAPAQPKSAKPVKAAQKKAKAPAHALKTTAKPKKDSAHRPADRSAAKPAGKVVKANTSLRSKNKKTAEKHSVSDRNRQKSTIPARPILDPALGQ